MGIDEGMQTREVAFQLERLFHRLATIGMACEAIDDQSQKDALSVSIADAQELVSEMIGDLRALAVAGTLAVSPSVSDGPGLTAT